MIRVVVVDDEVLLRSGLAGIVDTATDMTVVGLAADGHEAVALTRSVNPDVVLMDIRMPGAGRPRGHPTDRLLDGGQGPRPDHVRPRRVRLHRAEAGASGFLVKDTPPVDLLAAIRTVADGDALLSPRVTRRLIEHFVHQSEGIAAPLPVTPTAEVTPREREVWALVAGGLTNSEIAERLCITVGTAKTHVAHLLAKLDARDRVQLVILAHGSDATLPA